MPTREELLRRRLELLQEEEKLLAPKKTLPPGGNWGLGVEVKRITDRPPGIDYDTGVQDFGIRSQLSAQDSPEELMGRAEQIFGPGTVSRNSDGSLVVTGEGLRAAGLQPPPSGLPVAVEEAGVSRYDLADVVGSIPEFLGAVGGGMAASGMGVVPGLLAAGGGAMLGKGLGETAEQVAGLNTQGLGSVAGDVGMAGLAGAAGEGIYRGLLAPVGRALMAPGATPAHWMTGKPFIDPDRARLAEQARGIGGTPTIGQVTQHPVLGRTQQLAEMFLNNPTEKANAMVLQKQMEKLRGTFGKPDVSAAETGQAVKDAVGAGRRAMSDWAKGEAAKLDEMTGGEKLIPTAGLKKTIGELLEGRAKDTETGEPIGVPAATINQMKSFAGIEDQISLQQWQRLRTDIRNSIDDTTLMPSVSSHDASQMKKAVDGLLDDAVEAGGVNQGLAKAAQKFRQEYAEKASQFSSHAIERIARNPRYRASLDPEQVVREVIKPGNEAQTKRVLNLLPEGLRNDVRSVAMRDILDRVARPNPKDATNEVFRGAAFRSELKDKWKGKSLDAVFGKEHADELRKFAETQAYLVEKQPMIGGLAVSNVALHPWDNLPKAMEWRLWQKMLMNPRMLRYFTEGARAPKTRKGAAALARVATQAQTMLDEELEPGLKRRVQNRVEKRMSESAP